MATSNSYKIVVVEPDPTHRNYLRLQILDGGDTAVCFENETSCLDNLTLLGIDMVVLGRLTSERIYRFLYAAKYIDFRLPVVVVSGDPEIHFFIRLNGFYSTVVVSPAITSDDLKSVIREFKLGANDVLNFPVGIDPPMMVGTSPAMIRIKKAIFEIARSMEALLIEGESGSGKDLTARAVHFWSTNNLEGLIKIDSGGISPEVLENDLSDWLKTSTEDDETGESKRKRLISPRTVFFDEIGQMPIETQGILLRLFEQQGLLNDSRFRIIASTSQILSDLVALGQFRKDLFYRLNVFRVQIPPLRERRKDIPVLVDFFIDKYCRLLNKSHYNLPERAKSHYIEYDWPGNVRELENIVKSSVVVGDMSGYIESLCRCVISRNNKLISNTGRGSFKLVDPDEIKTYMEDLNSISLKSVCSEFIVRAEKKLMKQALDSTQWNRKKAAGLLNISYKSLLNKIKTYNLTA